MILGSNSAGKSTSVLRFVEDRFFENYDPKTEDSFQKIFQLNGYEIKLEILDTVEKEIVK